MSLRGLPPPAVSAALQSLCPCVCQPVSEGAALEWPAAGVCWGEAVSSLLRAWLPVGCPVMGSPPASLDLLWPVFCMREGTRFPGGDPCSPVAQRSDLRAHFLILTLLPSHPSPAPFSWVWGSGVSSLSQAPLTAWEGVASLCGEQQPWVPSAPLSAAVGGGKAASGWEAGCPEVA